MDYRKELRQAVEAGDDKKITDLFAEMQDKGLLGSFLKAGMLFGKDNDGVPELVDMMPFFDANHEIAGGPLLGNVAYHMGLDMADIDPQRMAVFFLMMHGADPNVTFTPTENMEDAKPLSAFNMLITSQIGRPVMEMTPSALLESMPHSLELGATEHEASKLEQVVNALHPYNLFQAKYQKPMSEEQEFDYMLVPWQKPPFDARQLQNAEDIIQELVSRGANLGDKVERLPESYHTLGFPLVQALGAYVAFIESAMQDPQAAKELMEKETADGWDVPEFEVDAETLRSAYEFYGQLFETARDIYLDAKRSHFLSSERGGFERF